MAKTFPNRGERQFRTDRNDPFGARADAVAARRVLRDCHHAAREFRSATTPLERRLRWFTVLVLLRSVGHVLAKVDGERSDHLRDAVKSQWRRVQAGSRADDVFHDFIERERNLLLKEYKSDEYVLEPRGTDDEADDLLVGAEVLTRNEALSRAIAWWERLLGDVEADAQASLRATRRSG
ncbi:hypothetical protein [Sphingomonas sp.]|jgi:hypothetical protein|uniref:hypothetical protein n=1 Tax=Sphingomonas sp. TaxID=28214 RepID=UPI00262B88CE|nr:hypothetical protein [Sphingomonas sp.]MDF2494577.1 hypothetical protein [Sphingomonas sp.]